MQVRRELKFDPMDSKLIGDLAAVRSATHVMGLKQSQLRMISCILVIIGGKAADVKSVT